MRRAGVSGDRPVVVYDDWDGRAAARAWWLLRYHGHPDVQVLDGGWRAWWQGGGDIEQGDVAGSRGPARATSPSVPRGCRWSRPTACWRYAVLVDARAPERYRGEVEPIDPVAGHIPGAVNVPTDANLAPEGRFRRPDDSAGDLRRRRRDRATPTWRRTAARA